MRPLLLVHDQLKAKPTFKVIAGIVPRLSLPFLIDLASTLATTDSQKVNLLGINCYAQQCDTNLFAMVYTGMCCACTDTSVRPSRNHASTFSHNIPV